MKIIKRGKPQGTVPTTTTCDSIDGCGTVFSWYQSEGKLVPDQRDGDYWDVKCPVCGRHIFISVDAVGKR
jgi:hypothetical protein